MGIMTHRSTYALDAETTRRIKQLAQDWGVSQAEVVRRSVHLAAEQETDPTPAEILAHYRGQSPARDWTQTRRLVEQLRTQRHADDTRRTQWHRK